MPKLESRFVQEDLIPALNHLFPGCFIYKLDPNQVQGIMDRLILWGPYWFTLETKSWEKAARQPNQEFYVEKFNDMSYSAFISPDNMWEVLNEIHATLGV